MSMRVTAVIDPNGSQVRARNERGHEIILDTDTEDPSAEPKEALLIALAGCTAMDVASILRKKRQPAATYEMAVSAESAEEHPRVFSTITVEHRVAGEVEPEALRRSIELSATRYCPVSAMLSASATIEHRYRLERPDGTRHEALVAVTGPDGARVA